MRGKSHRSFFFKSSKNLTYTTADEEYISSALECIRKEKERSINARHGIKEKVRGGSREEVVISLLSSKL